MVLRSLSSSSDLFSHLWQTVLPDYITNTLMLGALVVFLSLFFGTFSAAFIVHTNVLGKKYLRWLLLLPLAMPAYLVAYLYTDMFDYAGPIQRTLRGWFNWQSPNDYWFFDIRTLPGAAIVISLVLYPYVYMLTRTTFEQQDQNLLRAGRLLGLSAKQSLLSVALPLARPAIAVSTSLVLMETLADFATVNYFSVNTITTAIYDTWLGYGDLATANALASILMLIILFVVVAEQRARSSENLQSNRPNKHIEVIKLSFFQQFFISGFCWLLVFLGFLLPFATLIIMAFEYSDMSQLKNLISPSINSIEISIYAASIATLLALLFGFYRRLSVDKWRLIPSNLASFGYAVPGTVLAMALLASFGPLDHFINDAAEYFQLKTPGLVLSGTIFAIVFACVVRFAAIANGTISSGIEQIPRSVDFAPSSLGASFREMLIKVHIPILKPSILVAWLLVFVESMKELPAVLLLRPFNFDTLSIQIYQLISDEILEQGALSAILIVLLGLLPIVWLNRTKELS